MSFKYRPGVMIRRVRFIKDDKLDLLMNCILIVATWTECVILLMGRFVDSAIVLRTYCYVELKNKKVPT